MIESGGEPIVIRLDGKIIEDTKAQNMQKDSKRNKFRNKLTYSEIKVINKWNK